MILAICLGIFFAPSVFFLVLIAAKRWVPRRRPRPFVGPWRAWYFCPRDPSLRVWGVARRVGETIENLYYPPLGYKDTSTLATFKTRREARRAAAKANSERKN